MAVNQKDIKCGCPTVIGLYPLEYEGFRIYTDAIKNHLILNEITPMQASAIYAEEADVLNVASFGMTAKQWREANSGLEGNICDYATINELICLLNMENIN